MTELRRVYQDKMSIDKYQQSMENWKKEIIIDPHLNGLFDAQLTPQQFLQNKILTLPHDDLIKVYVKLTSLRHAIAKNMQKEIEVTHPSIERAFQDTLRSKNKYEQISQDNLRQQLKHIQRFNEKYELISDRVTEIRNINKILYFAKALEKFKVNVRLLKSLMKDFDQSGTSHFQSELLNTLKISKIIKEISAITIRYDFSGIKSYEDERVFLNNTKGAMFGLIEKELTVALSKIPGERGQRRAQLEKDIINKFMILNNITKLKDFCIPFYKNTLKEMSQLLKKSLVIGLSAEERDPRAYLETFEEYFTHSLRRRLVQNGVIFICFDELLSKSQIKTPFNFNFFEKYWENITGFMKDLIAWSMDNDAKECSKDKLTENLYESFSLLDGKGYIPKYLVSIIWKYPIIYEAITSISNEIHLYIIKHAQLHHYDFAQLKQKLVRVLLPLAQLYYKNIKSFYSIPTQKAANLRVKLEADAEGNAIARASEMFQEQKGGKFNEGFDQTFRIVDWLIFGIKIKEIYEHHFESILSIMDQYYQIMKISLGRVETQQLDRQSLRELIGKYDGWVNKVKAILNRKKINKELEFQPQFKSVEPSRGVFASDSEALVKLIRRFMKYEALVRENSQKLQ